MGGSPSLLRSHWQLVAAGETEFFSSFFLVKLCGHRKISMLRCMAPTPRLPWVALLGPGWILEKELGEAVFGGGRRRVETGANYDHFYGIRQERPHVETRQVGYWVIRLLITLVTEPRVGTGHIHQDYITPIRMTGSNPVCYIQVLNQTTRLELQLLQHSISTNKLEKQILDQTSEINKLQDKNR